MKTKLMKMEMKTFNTFKTRNTRTRPLSLFWYPAISISIAISMSFATTPVLAQTTAAATILTSASNANANANANAIPISFDGMNYNTRRGPDWAADADRCKTRSEIVRDLTLLARVTTKIRILSLADCRQAERVLSVLRDEVPSLGVWLGVWVGSDPWAVEHELGVLDGLLSELVAVWT